VLYGSTQGTINAIISLEIERILNDPYLAKFSSSEIESTAN